MFGVGLTMARTIAPAPGKTAVLNLDWDCPKVNMAAKDLAMTGLWSRCQRKVDDCCLRYDNNPRAMKREWIATVANTEHSVVIEPQSPGRWNVVIGDRQRLVDARRISDTTWSLAIDGEAWLVDLATDGTTTVAMVGSTEISLTLEDARRRRLSGSVQRPDDEGQVVRAPIAGKVVKSIVKVGDQVAVGDALMVLEAMKMENEIRASVAGVVVSVNVEAGHSVESREILLVIE